MKRSIRVALLLCGLVVTYVAAAVASGPAIDGGPFCPYRVCCRPGGSGC